MDFEITEDGVFAICNASRILTRADILELATEYFTTDLKDGLDYILIELDEPEDENINHWFLVPKDTVEDLCQRHVDSKKRGRKRV